MRSRTTKHKTIRRLLLPALFVGVLVGAPNANASTGCTDGSRVQAAAYATSGQFYNPMGVTRWVDPAPVGVGQTVSGSVELRYNPVTRCAWAVMSGSGGAQVWMDRSTDGGQTWSSGSRLGYRQLGFRYGTTYTGVFNDASPAVMRACAADFGPIRCTTWF